MNKLERVVIVGLRLKNQSASQFRSLMDELRRLVETAGGRVDKEITQTLARPEPGTLIGKGKASEIAEELSRLKIKTVVFDDDLTAAQQKNIEKITQAKVIDRTRLILDIFAQRARTREGQLQIELAQLNYLVPRLTGAWRGFSQQMGGIGTRGPGERKIEVERRYVRERIKRLKKEIEDVKRHRSRVREGRERVPLPQVALIGYTNVGKSTLLNALVGNRDAVYADDKLFATLDPTTRRVRLPDGRVILFTDTVGFIQKLPTDLIAAFRATLEEVSRASLLIHLLDATAPDRADQERTVLDVVQSLQGGHIPILTVINKSDCLTPSHRDAFQRQGYLLLSSKTGDGLKGLLVAVEHKLDETLLDVSFDLPHAKLSLIAPIYRTAHVLEERSHDRGTWLHIRIDPANWKRLSDDLNKAEAA